MIFRGEKMDLETKTVIESYTILARALKSNGKTMKKKRFVHESGFNSIQGKYSHAYDTRGLLIASEEYCELNAYKPPTDSSDLQLRVNEYGEIVHPPFKPEKPNTKNWKRMTPKRQDILAQYRKDLADYEVAKAKWDTLPLLNDGRSTMEHRMEFLKNRPSKYGINHRAYYDYIQGVFEYEVPVLSYYVRGYGEVRMTAYPVRKTEIEIREFEEGDWVQQDILDIAWRRAELERMRKEKKQHYRKFIREQEDNTVQTTLTGNVWNVREVTNDFLHNFTGDVELVWKFFTTSFEVRGCLHGSVDINEVCFSLTKEELDKVYAMRG